MISPFFTPWRRATLFTTSNFEHIPPELLAHQLCGVAACDAVEPMLALARRDGWSLDARRVACPARIVWGTEDRLLSWPDSAARYQTTGCRTPTGWCSTASGTVPSSTSRSRPRS
jgi:pimeloyl-ACP methyl ester carboxylesterase